MDRSHPPRGIPEQIVRARRIAGGLLVVAVVIVLIGLIMLFNWQGNQVNRVY